MENPIEKWVIWRYPHDLGNHHVDIFLVNKNVAVECLLMDSKGHD